MASQTIAAVSGSYLTVDSKTVLISGSTNTVATMVSFSCLQWESISGEYICYTNFFSQLIFDGKVIVPKYCGPAYTEMFFLDPKILQGACDLLQSRNVAYIAFYETFW